jgi:hypothetical protein
MTTQASPVPLHERCQYTNKQCPNRRMTKRNGQLHRLCVEHRDKANNSQRRWLACHLVRTRTNTKRPTSTSAELPNLLPDATSNNSMLWGDVSPSMDEIDKIHFDEDEMDDFVAEFLLTQEELRALHEDVIRACRFLAS